MFHLNLAFSSIEEENRALRHRALLLAAAGAGLDARSHRHRSDRLHARGNRSARSGLDRAACAISSQAGKCRARRLRLCADDRAAGARHRRRCQSAARQRGLSSAFWASGRPSRSSTSRPIPAGLVGHYLDAGYRALLMDWDNPAAASSGMASRSALSAADARAGADGRDDRAALDQHGRVPETAALRPWRHRARRLSRFRRGRTRRAAARPLPLCQRRRNLRFSSRPLSHRGSARRTIPSGTASPPPLRELPRSHGMQLVAPSARSDAGQDAAARRLRLESAA